MNATRKKILIVDDSKTILLMERMILGNGPWELIVAFDGEDAVEKARAELPDLVLMDVVMPRMNGFDACRQLRTHGETAHIPVIMVTTRGETESVEAGFESGCADYVMKPIDPEELIAKVESYLEGGRDVLPC